MGKITERSGHRRRWQGAWAVAAWVALGACGDTAVFDSVATLDRAAYAPGDTGTVRLVNDGSTDLYFNLCPRQLERQDPDLRWVVAPEFPTDRACPEYLGRLAPGQSTTDLIVFPDPLPDGTYRWVFTGLARDEIAGGAFVVATTGVAVSR